MPHSRGGTGFQETAAHDGLFRRRPLEIQHPCNLYGASKAGRQHFTLCAILSPYDEDYASRLDDAIEKSRIMPDDPENRLVVVRPGPPPDKGEPL